MADEVQRYRPQLLGGVGVERPFLDTVAVVEQIRIVAYGVGLASVIKVVAAGSGEFGGDRRDECRGGPLLGSLVDEDSRWYSRRPKWMSSNMTGDLVCPVELSETIRASPRPHPVRGLLWRGLRASRDSGRSGQDDCGELKFPAFRGSDQAAYDDASVVDQYVQWPGPPAGELGDGGTVDEIQRADVNVAVAGRLRDVLGCLRAGAGVADRKGDLSTGAREGAGCLHADPRRRAGDLARISSPARMYRLPAADGTSIASRCPTARSRTSTIANDIRGTAGTSLASTRRTMSTPAARAPCRD
jgi:hypothetical protein